MRRRYRHTRRAEWPETRARLGPEVRRASVCNIQTAALVNALWSRDGNVNRGEFMMVLQKEGVVDVEQ